MLSITIADPLSGACAALVVACSVIGGGGQLIDLSMRATASVFAAEPAVPHGPHPVERRGEDWLLECSHLGRGQPVLPPPIPLPEPAQC